MIIQQVTGLPPELTELINLGTSGATVAITWGVWRLFRLISRLEQRIARIEGHLFGRIEGDEREDGEGFHTGPIPRPGRP